MTEPAILDLPINDAAADEDGGGFRYDIVAYPSDWSLQTYKDKWDKKEVLIPEYQREYVWTTKTASRLVESLMIGLPVPQIFLYETADRKHEVVDGYQRLRSVFDFMDGKFRLRGTDTAQLENKFFTDLTEANRRALTGATLRAIVVRQINPEDDGCKYRIFERLNTGGLALKAQEVRNCIYGGAFNEVLDELNANNHWRAILGSRKKDRHKRDIELILRVFALSQISPYKRPMRDFLNRAMKEHKDAATPEVARFRRDFPECAKVIVEKLGKKPFHLRMAVNSAMLDAVFCVMIQRFRGNIPGNIRARYRALIDSGVVDQNSKSDEKTVHTRIETTGQYLFGEADE